MKESLGVCCVRALTVDESEGHACERMADNHK